MVEGYSRAHIRSDQVRRDALSSGRAAQAAPQLRSKLRWRYHPGIFPPTAARVNTVLGRVLKKTTRGSAISNQIAATKRNLWNRAKTRTRKRAQRQQQQHNANDQRQQRHDSGRVSAGQAAAMMLAMFVAGLVVATAALAGANRALADQIQHTAEAAFSLASMFAVNTPAAATLYGVGTAVGQAWSLYAAPLPARAGKEARGPRDGGSLPSRRSKPPSQIECRDPSLLTLGSVWR